MLLGTVPVPDDRLEPTATVGRDGDGYSCSHAESANQLANQEIRCMGSPTSTVIRPDRMVFLGGAPRSGTTFLQLLLFASGHFATSQETHLFPAFLGRLDERWRAFLGRGQTHRNVGLPAVISRLRFDELLRDMAAAVMNEISTRQPGAGWTVEKTPENVLAWPLIKRLFPDARFIVLVRDPRAVVASTVAARSWAGDWAHRDVSAITDAWLRSLKATLALEEAHPETIRVTYEGLSANTPAVLREILAQFGITLSWVKARKITSQVSLRKLKTGGFAAPWVLEDEPLNFFRTGHGDSWKHELSLGNIALIEEMAREEMRVFGYAPVVKMAE